MGPNHRHGCNGNTWRYSGQDYNRVKVCACGAEDHSPDDASLRELETTVAEMVADERDKHAGGPRIV